MIYNKIARKVMIFGAGASMIAALTTSCGGDKDKKGVADTEKVAKDITEAIAKRDKALADLGYWEAVPTFDEAKKAYATQNCNDDETAAAVAATISSDIYGGVITAGVIADGKTKVTGALGDFINANIKGFDFSDGTKAKAALPSAASAIGTLSFAAKHNALVLKAKKGEDTKTELEAVKAAKAAAIVLASGTGAIFTLSGDSEFTEKPETKYLVTVTKALKEIAEANAVIGKEGLPKVLNGEDVTKAEEKKEEKK